MHAVDKVHVGDARRPEHDPVARRRAHPRVRRAVVLADVGLDLDDPPDPARRWPASPGAGSRTRRAPSSARAASSDGPGEQVARERTRWRAAAVRASRSLQVVRWPRCSPAGGTPTRPMKPGSPSRGGCCPNPDPLIASQTGAGTAPRRRLADSGVYRKYWSRMIVRNRRNRRPCTTPRMPPRTSSSTGYLANTCSSVRPWTTRRTRSRRRRTGRGTRSSRVLRSGTASSSRRGTRRARTVELDGQEERERDRQRSRRPGGRPLDVAQDEHARTGTGRSARRPRSSI